MATNHKPRIGLALGGGSARGWAHIGVLDALAEAGVHPDIVCGTSIGALVGAAYSTGHLGQLQEWVRGLGIWDVLGFLDVTARCGLVKLDRLGKHLRQQFDDPLIEQLPIPFAAVATSLGSGGEVWLRNGSIFDAVRASIAIPGLFTPVLHDGMVLVDGGLVNPVPVSVARAMGADLVIAVDLGSDILGRRLRAGSEPETPASAVGEWLHKLQGSLDIHIESPSDSDPQIPSILDVLSSSLDIMQVRISRSRMAGDPPDLIVAPRLSQLRLLDFHKAEEAIEEGRRAVQRVAPMLAAFRRD
jgi:NTE family protein